MECRLLDVEILLPTFTPDDKIEQAIDRAILETGLIVTLRASLKKFPGCVHWHLKNGPESGTLEITHWPQEHRAWFTVQSGRTAKWIDKKIELLENSIQRHLR